MDKLQTSRNIMNLIMERDPGSESMKTAYEKLYQYLNVEGMPIKECTVFEDLLGNVVEEAMLNSFISGFKTALNLAQEMGL